MPLYLGLDCSTQSFTALVVEADGPNRRVVFESTIVFERDLPEYGARHGVLPSADPGVAVAPPLMWADGLERMMDRVVRSGVDVRRLAAISGSAQQHGSVYLNAAASAILPALDPARALPGQIARTLARPVAPIWMDSSTAAECGEITLGSGGRASLARATGSRAFERFTAAQIRKFWKQDPDGYAATDRVHLVSSFLASLLAGRHAPIDPGDGSGMNLMDLRTRAWWPDAVAATAPDLAVKLPPIAPSSSIVGALSPYWQKRFGLPPARVVAWSGDNPCSLIGTGLVEEGRVAISLGTSDTIFGLMREPRVDPLGTGHVFGSPTGDYMGLTCFMNASLARERVRDSFGLSWESFSAALASTPAGNHGRVMIPWFDPEITPAVPNPAVHRHALSPDDGPGNVRAVIEAQQMALALHSAWMGVGIRTIHATGGAATNRAILRVMADVFGADVYQFAVANSAALGAALRAYHADALAGGAPRSWNDTVRGLAEPLAATRIQPIARHNAVYADLMRVYAEHESQALKAGGARMV